ncbi:hypothetical protein Leryth_016938 [Lithospermum erythrorhizon]|nr:hypothetical protein Leryth_016938 [Lithospermum erythrorhizon]
MEIDDDKNRKSTVEIEAPKDRRLDALGNLVVLPDEILCAILAYLTPNDISRAACVSSVMYILCNEEPLWMWLCLRNINRQLQYKGSWKKTTLHQLNLLDKIEEATDRKPISFDGFYSLFLYRRMYRCYTSLNAFSFDNGNVERKENLSLEAFREQYDGVKPVLISGLTDTWPARNTWTIEQLLMKYGDTTFRISQRSPKKVTMKFKDYVTYMQIQHDEDPLYIFDDKFGEVAPDLLKDYSVPDLFQEDFFDVLDIEQRPAFRWFIIGPERSGASWHVDPALTSAWNTLLCGRKRWALYPPGRVPLGVTVHVNEEDGDVDIDTPSSLQWWLDFYPLLADEDKPIEVTQLPGETIFVPSGWWHCVLNLETTVAVTQNFVNSKNLEFVCLDMAPGYRHKGVCRAGFLALDEDGFDYVKKKTSCPESCLSYTDLTRKEKRVRNCHTVDDVGRSTNLSYNNLEDMEFSYDINFLSMFLDRERDHYNAPWSLGNCIGQREMRGWLKKLWVLKPGLRDLIWKGACIAIDAGKWLECLKEICLFHGLPLPKEDEKLPVGTGSNPVYLIGDNVVKIFVEGGLEDSLYNLGTELEFYSLLDKVNSSLKKHIPDVFATGILSLENELFKVMTWDGKGVPELPSTCNVIPEEDRENLEYPFGISNKRKWEYKKAGLPPLHESLNYVGGSTTWPYIVTRRCNGKVFAELRDTLSWEDALNLASFLGEQMRNLHLLPCPSLNELMLVGSQETANILSCNGSIKEVASKGVPAEWMMYVRTLNRKKKDVTVRLTKWGDPIPTSLIEKVHEYLPDDFGVFYCGTKDEVEACRPCTWIHSDVMDDNVFMEPKSAAASLNLNTSDPCVEGSVQLNCTANLDCRTSWLPTHILDFSDMSLGDPILDIIPMCVDLFRSNNDLLKRFLESYKLPLGRRKLLNASIGNDKYARLSYITMCHCILHDDNVLGAIFSLSKELRMAKSWEEVEEAVWGGLNSYTGVC